MTAVVTLRSRYQATAPQVGMLMASRGGGLVYRVLSVAKLSRAGDPRGCRYRITCEKLRKSAVPSGAIVHPWIDAPNPRPKKAKSDQPRREVLWTRVERQRAEADQLQRADRVGKDRGVVNLQDFGPGLQLDAVYGGRRERTMLRPAAVVVQLDQDDPAVPGRRIRRARRIDPMDLLLRSRSIDQRQYDAAEHLRDLVQQSHHLTGGSGLGEAHVDCSAAVSMGVGKLLAWTAAREAMLAIGTENRPVLTWVVLRGGTLDGFSASAAMRRATPPQQLRDGLTELADHLFGPPVQRGAAMLGVAS